MVEKRRSPGGSPPDAHRRKKLTTRPGSAEPMDVDSQTSLQRRTPPQSPVANSNSARLDQNALQPQNVVCMRHHFPVIDYTNPKMLTPAVDDAQGGMWRVVWLPQGSTDQKYVGVLAQMMLTYEQMQQQEQEPPRLAEVEIILYSQKEQRQVRKRTGVHPFSKENAEFGLTEFILRSELIKPENGFLTPEGRVEVEVQLHLYPPEGDRREDVAMEQASVSPEAGAPTDSQATMGTTQELLSYDSKEETGMVGLKNQGATCYLNSLLQTLFHLRAFRQVVYETPTTQEDTNDSVSLALQRVFYRLQRQRKAVSTKELTRSFGWSQIDSFMQHDVQELYRILCDRLEEKMKHTRVDSAIQKLFEGKVRSFVQCVNVDFQSSRDESFYDLQLDVKGCRDLMQSFRKYVEVEMLDGDNQYEAEGHGKQDAKKGIHFLSLPPVLNIQLKRFEYDPMRDGMVKIHDRFEFPKTLVLDEFLSGGDEEKIDSSKDKAPRHIYHLHSVLVHSGDVHGGHYYVFIRPGKHIATSTDWFRFDDDQITRVDEQTAIEGNFGSLGTPLDEPTEPPSPVYSSSLFCSPEHGNGSNNGPNAMDGLEFRSMDTGGEEVGRAVDEYDYSRNNGSGDLPLTGNASASNSLMLPLGRSFSSAYMLVYVRDGENDISTIQEVAVNAGLDAQITPATSSASEDLSIGDMNTNSSALDSVPQLPSWQSDPLPIPEELVSRFHEEEKAVARRKKAQQTEHLYMTVRIASDTSITKLKRITKTMDFASFNNSNTMRVRIKRASPIRQLYRRLYHETGVPMMRQRLWKVITRENRTVRPDLPLSPDTYDSPVDSLIDDDASPKTPVRLYLQILNAPAEPSAHTLAASPPISPSSPSSRTTMTGNLKIPGATIHRHFWSEFTRSEIENDNANGDGKPSQEMVDEDEDAATTFSELSDGVTVDHAPPLEDHQILLFVKFYDLKRKLGERLKYMGNIVVDSRTTGAQLSKYLHEALSIPSTIELLLFEEVQPVSVSEIDMRVTLVASEIQHGDIICYQYVEDEESATGIVVAPIVEDDPDASETTYIGPDGEEVKTVIYPGSDENSLDSALQSSTLLANGIRGPHSQVSTAADQAFKQQVERYPDVRSYFQYLLDRVEITFHRYGHGEEESFMLALLNSNVYDEVIDAVAAHLGLVGPKRLYVRLYQHSPLNGLPMKTPLRHTRYSGDDQTTLEELLAEYMERTNIMYYELLDHPITEIEAKKQLVVHLSVYDACFATEQAASPSPLALQRQIEVLVLPTHRVRDLLELVRKGFGLPENTLLRACEVVQRGSVIQRRLKPSAGLSRFWENNAGCDPNAPEIFVEQICVDELAKIEKNTGTNTAADGKANDQDAAPDDGDQPMWIYKGVVHFNFQNSSQSWIHPHGVPCVVRFHERETVGQVKERIRQRMGISSDVFAQWNFALVKDLKASTLSSLYEDMGPEVLDALPMGRLQEHCGADFEALGSLGLEHADPTPPPRHHSSSRRLEQGIHIR
ncbi:Ubiquitin carboxyl-terminal hydrolase 7 [Phytophthora boehmeriae]|uniref:ubiquitinyl hydrolase 1 n=1 Tax=Phytophthora boehmeriae TaxID=109152 RepID=A0A8T1WW47_9STRA|nr:Ubiquitin carboxyl-terminal hydrolase 7 [Phytophthora boehmeriae]